MKKSKEGRFSARKESKVIEYIDGFVMCYLYEVHKIIFFFCFIIIETMKWILIKFLLI